MMCQAPSHNNPRKLVPLFYPHFTDGKLSSKRLGVLSNVTQQVSGEPRSQTQAAISEPIL